ncbi:MAG: type VI secretion system-associated protein TagF [Gammaproteobacteria bacterium]|nr:type VI secretion system-associated protein TagF [Gammaproteobacteria bacterium]
METLEQRKTVRHQNGQQGVQRVPGYYGKLPQRGDFISSGLESGFVRSWDNWISEGIDYSKQALGDQWLQRYLHAPIWRFYIAKGVLDDNANTGLWFSSMDKVGRYFPFTFCCSIEEAPDNWIEHDRVAAFFKRLERIGMVALDEACGIEDVDDALAETPWPLQGRATQRMSTGLLGESTGNPDDINELDKLLLNIVRNDHPQLTLWWSMQDDGMYRYKIYDGMPPRESFLDFI